MSIKVLEPHIFYLHAVTLLLLVYLWGHGACPEEKPLRTLLVFSLPF